jgi:Semialdehyde dehydrogenase, NAD binding domain.
MGKTAIVIGATGLVGEELVKQLIGSEKFERVKIFARKSSGFKHQKIDEYIINFDEPMNWASLVTGDILFSTLGTTIKTAGSKENQYNVDFTYQYEFAKAAAQNGVPAYVLVSSLGADSKSSVFYSRMKGELDEAVSKLSFQKTIIVRPSILDGSRKEKRPVGKISLAIMRHLTKFILKKYRPMPVDILASRMIEKSLDSKPGLDVIEGINIF